MYHIVLLLLCFLPSKVRSEVSRESSDELQNMKKLCLLCVSESSVNKSVTLQHKHHDIMFSRQACISIF